MGGLYDMNSIYLFIRDLNVGMKRNVYMILRDPDPLIPAIEP